MVHIAADLPQFLQRRELAAYEQRLARTAYAYGVDLRRAQWLAMSTVADPLMRTVDRSWSRLVAELDAECLRLPRKAPPTAVLEEIATLMHALRAPLPTIRLLGPGGAGQWPTVTPLGTTKGGIHWLVLDLDRLMAMPAAERTFVLASGLGHLQCDHGSIFAAHLLAHRGRRMGMIKTIVRPWAKVSVFSAHRAGLLMVRSLEVARSAIERQDQERVPWWPRWPSLATQQQALADFDRSAIMARSRVLGSIEGGAWSLAPERPEPLQRRIGNAVRRVLRFREEAAENVGSTGGSSAEGGRAAHPPASDESHVHGAEPGEDESAESEASPEPALAPEFVLHLEEALRDTWSLTRCDQRLTRRLGLL